MIARNPSSLHRLRPWPGVVLVLTMVIIGLLIYKDYGVAWDEGTMRQVGHVNLEYMRTGNEALLKDFPDIDHGAAFEVPLKWAEETAGISDSDAAGIHRFRHITCFLFYVYGLWAGYRLALRLFRRQWLALLAVVMLVLQPRIFAHAFINCKDVPFMSAMLIAVNAISAAFGRQQLYWFILAGIAAGYASGIRIMGLLVVGLTGALLLRDVIAGPSPTRRKAMLQAAVFTLATLLTLYACWPALWRHPVDGLMYSYQRLSNYKVWRGDVLFNGLVEKGFALPLYYVPEWVLISTPVLWSVLFLYGAGAGLLAVLRKRRLPLRTPRHKVLMLCAALTTLPVVAIMLLHSTLYDDWRHLYFIYPPGVMLALYGAEWLAARGRRVRLTILSLCAMEAVVTIAAMAEAHPYELVYFNELVPRRDEWRRRHFDYEYWGTSYGAGLRHVLSYDNRDSVLIVRHTSPQYDNAMALPEPLRKRIRWTLDERGEQGAYLITTYRFLHEDPPYPKIWGLKVAGSTVVQVYRVDTTAWKK